MRTGSAAILPFRARPAGPPPARAGFSLRERVRVAEWVVLARRFGLTRVVAEFDAEQGGFVLVYADDKPWAAYGIGVEHGSYIAWRPYTALSFGPFEQLTDALAAVIAHRNGGTLPPQV